ncbi:MAG: phospho-N-acetylmuramoyl-pentapeptide-transferase [Planctomycetaceae bacterium]
MLLWLLHRLTGLADTVGAATSGDTRVYLTARTAAAALCSFVAALLCGPVAIRWLKSRFRERIDSASSRLNELHAAKQGTPTMGGLFLVGAILAAVVVFGDLTSRYVQIATGLLLSYAVIGGADDWIKLRTARRGLSARQKFAWQIVCGAAAATCLYAVQRTHPLGTDLVWPFGGGHWPLGVVFVAWGTLVLVGSSNGVNLTDGLDGLAAGCLLTSGTAFAAVTYLTGHHHLAEYLQIPFMSGAGELTVVLGAMVGAVLGFLWYNAHPAEVFMGDTGSLPLGGLLGLAALVTRQELLLVVVGGVFVIETLSVILQVGCYKLLGRRVIACSPLHNHFVFRGMSEIKIVTRFWIVSVLLAILGVASLQIR